MQCAIEIMAACKICRGCLQVTLLPQSERWSSLISLLRQTSPREDLSRLAGGCPRRRECPVHQHSGTFQLLPQAHLHGTADAIAGAVTPKLPQLTGKTPVTWYTLLRWISRTSWVRNRLIFFTIKLPTNLSFSPRTLVLRVVLYSPSLGIKPDIYLHRQWRE